MMQLRQFSIILYVGVFSSYLVLLALGQATLLPDAEVAALKEIASTLGKTDWDFSVDPCSGQSGWVTSSPVRPENAVTCNCSYIVNNNTVCHVVSIVLRAQNLPGILPPELAKLPFLQEIDLLRNYLNGSIPKEWGSLPLVNLTLAGNRIRSPIPLEFTNITSLRIFTVDFNHIYGALPPEIGNMVNLERLLLTSNDFSGPLPETLVKLINLKDFRISDNQFTGKIPDFIQSWTKLEKLIMQGSGLQGPIPSVISALINLTDIRISDLTGSIDAPFPPLSNMNNIRTLVLRGCNIIGAIPAYLGDMIRPKILDLSFNKLTGQIPSSFDNLGSVEYIYLTGNALTGPVSESMLKRGDNIDLSYNNFASSSTRAILQCQDRNVNLFGSSSLGKDSAGVVPCLKSFRCPKDINSFHINCGGRQLNTSENVVFEDDTDIASSSKFYLSRTNWAFSSTGNFMDDDTAGDTYIATNTSRLMMNDSSLYMTARLSPLSLTYYGLCLVNGYYTVSLHFAEIIFINDKTFSSLGRRIFDIYIQGERVLKDFNIEDEAGGVGKAIIKKFTATVTQSAIDIRFYWAGKGTVGIPSRGIYGPLVSAISVNLESLYSKPPLDGAEDGDGKKVTPGLVVGIVLSVLSVVLMSLGVLWWKGCSGRKHEIDQGDILTGLKRQANLKVLLESCKFLALQRYKYSDIMVMTKSFKHTLGQGGYGHVFKGTLRNDGRLVAVKVLNESKGNGEEFINEVATIGRTNHVNVVNLLGFCIEGTKRALVYEFMPNGSLEKYIYNEKTSGRGSMHLGWEKLYQIALGIARGLEYLHCRCNTRILHFDIKPHNILLDHDFLPKISDFGLAKLCPTKESIVSMVGTRGTMGYIAPELSCRNLGGVSHKSDVYSYGMMVLEMIGGRKNLDVTVENMSGIYFPHWIYNQLKRDFEIEEPEEIKLEGAQEILKDKSAKKMIIVALWCIQTHPTNRPSMTKVVEMLEESDELLQMPPNPSLDPLPLS